MINKLIISIFFVFIHCFTCFAQQKSSFDSVKIYSKSFYGTDQHSNLRELIATGDTMTIRGEGNFENLYQQLVSLKKNGNESSLRKLRKNFFISSINVKAVFIFFKRNNTQTIIGISQQPLIFIDKKLFERKDSPLELVLDSYPQLQKSLFPTKDEL